MSYKGMDAATRAYFRGTYTALNAWDDKRIGVRADLRTAYSSDRGRSLRRCLAEKGIIAGYGRVPPGMERAVATASLWMQWKKQQTGKPVDPRDLPPHCQPVAGPIKHDWEAVSCREG